MALLAPNIYIAQYLKDTQQLTPAIEQKIVNFLTNGESLVDFWSNLMLIFLCTGLLTGMYRFVDHIAHWQLELGIS